MLIRVFNNGVLASSITCSSDGTFRINLTLSRGANSLTARHYDILNQAGPASAKIKVYFEPEPIRDSDSNPNNRQSDDERLFEGTVVEPLAKALGIEQNVSPQINSTLNIVFNVAMATIVLTLAVLIIL